jgi:hypothetical protein
MANRGLITATLLFCGYANAAELPVTRIVLFKPGVAYLERAGKLADGDSVQLEFRAREMDDVLKSLNVRQAGGGGVSSVRFDSADPLSRVLGLFPFDVGQAASLSSILDQFKGADLELILASGAIRGKIVSARAIPASMGNGERQELVLVSGGALRAIDPAAAAELRFTDFQIQRQFEDYLNAIANSRNRESKRVFIESSGGPSEVELGYVTAAPVWKSSYRLSLTGVANALLEGWAVIDNTSNDDWTGISLTLVSGLPVSFINPLYQPIYVARPTAQLKTDRAWQPKIHGGAVEYLRGNEPLLAAAYEPAEIGTGSIRGRVTDMTGAAIPNTEVIARRGASGRPYRAVTCTYGEYVLSGLPAGEYELSGYSPGFKRAVRRGIQVGNYRQTPADFSLDLGNLTETVTVEAEFGSGTGLGGGSIRLPGRSLQTTFSSTAEGLKLGDFFQYRLENPITVKKGSSAMVPFSRVRLAVRGLVVFDESQGSQHPLHAIRITNSSGQTLDGGAVTVFDEGGYAGDALVETINAGDERIISYAVDLGTRISTAFDGESRLQRKFQIKIGIMTTQRIDSQVKTFTIYNVDGQPKTVVIEHPVRDDYPVIGSEPVEKTADLYRFEVAALPRETVKYAIREERLQSESLELSDLDFDDLKLQIDNQELDPAGRAALQRIANMHQLIDKQGEEEKRIREHADELIRDQTRLRQNIETLNAVTGQAQRVQEYASRLAQIDDEIAQSRRRQMESQARSEELDQQLEKLIAALEF